jgi:hypothetical protein
MKTTLLPRELLISNPPNPRFRFRAIKKMLDPSWIE